VLSGVVRFGADTTQLVRQPSRSGNCRRDWRRNLRSASAGSMPVRVVSTVDLLEIDDTGALMDRFEQACHAEVSCCLQDAFPRAPAPRLIASQHPQPRAAHSASMALVGCSHARRATPEHVRPCRDVQWGGIPYSAGSWRPCGKRTFSAVDRGRRPARESSPNRLSNQQIYKTGPANITADW
jgi:hypothetical protein